MAEPRQSANLRILGSRPTLRLRSYLLILSDLFSFGPWVTRGITLLIWARILKNGVQIGHAELQHSRAYMHAALRMPDPTHIRVVQRWVKVDGEKQPVEKKQRVSPWWRTDLSGNYIISIKFGLTAAIKVSVMAAWFRCSSSSKIRPELGHPYKQDAIATAKQETRSCPPKSDIELMIQETGFRLQADCAT